MAILVVLIGLLWATAALAQEDEFGLLPDDEILEGGQASLEYESEGQRVFGQGMESTLTLRAGVGDRAEVGVAASFSGPASTVGVLKLSLRPPRPGRLEVMVGSEALGAGGAAGPYLLLSERRPRLDVFAGVARGERRTLPFWNIEPQLTEEVSLFAQGIRGARWSFGLGLSADLTPRLALDLTHQFGKTELEDVAAGDQWILDLTYTWGPSGDPPAGPASPLPSTPACSGTARSAAPRTPGR